MYISKGQFTKLEYIDVQCSISEDKMIKRTLNKGHSQGYENPHTRSQKALKCVKEVIPDQGRMQIRQPLEQTYPDHEEDPP